MMHMGGVRMSIGSAILLRICLVWTSILLSFATYGQEVRFTRLYRTDMGSNGPRLSNRTTPGISPDGALATFHEVSGATRSGLYMISNGVTSRVVPVGTGGFSAISHNQAGFDVNNNGEVAFLGTRDDFATVYIYRGGPAVRVGTQYSPQESAVQINGGGVAAFAQGPSTYALEIYSGNENGLAIRSAGHPPGFWDVAHGAQINDSGNVAFHARHSNYSVFLNRNNSLEEIVTTYEGTGDPDSPFSMALCYGISNADEVLVSAKLRAGGEGLYRWTNGNLSSIITSADGYYDFGGNYLTGNSQPAINGHGDVAFAARDDFGLHIFMTRGSNNRVSLFSSGDMIDGLRLSSFSFGANSFSDNGKLAFYARFDNGLKGIYTVELVPEADPVIPLAFLVGIFVILNGRRSRARTSLVQ